VTMCTSVIQWYRPQGPLAQSISRADMSGSHCT
jgi:hypothetical protein